MYITFQLKSKFNVINCTFDDSKTVKSKNLLTSSESGDIISNLFPSLDATCLVNAAVLDYCWESPINKCNTKMHLKLHMREELQTVTERVAFDVPIGLCVRHRFKGASVKVKL